MKIVFGGVEIPSNRTLLERSGVEHVILNYWGLRKRGLPKTKPYLIGEHFLPNMKVWVDSGAVQADKANLSKMELEEYAADYEEFISMNYDRIEGWVEFDSQVMGFNWILEQRDAFENDPKMWVVWHEIYGQNLLTRWGSEYANIAIPGDAVESLTSLAAIVRSIKINSSAKFMALATAKPDNLRQIPFDYASTLAWISPMRRGETIIWDNTKLIRYPKKMKAQARLRYKSVVEKAGLDFKKFIEDDTLEATKVAIWSYLQLEKTMDKNKKNIIADNSDDTLYSGLMELGVGSSNNSDGEERKLERTEVVQRDPNEVVPMPVFGYQMKSIVDNIDGHEVLREVPVVQSNNSSLRQCDTCFVAANCPAFKPTNTCAFNLPVEVKTKEQLKSLLTAIVEMQGQRVAFMRFAEEMNGGYADPNVSQEIDRLFKLVGSMKELETNKEFIQITASRQTEGGALSRIFGDRASVLRNLDKPLSEDQTTHIIRDALE
jgi:hypothetical protein